MPPHIPATDEQTPTTKEWAFLAGNGGSWVRMVMMARVGGRVVVRVRSAPRFATTAAGPLLRRDVHFALENDGWNCTFECEVHVSASEGAQEDVAAGPMATTADTPAGPPGRSGRLPRPPPDSRRPSRARGGAVCPNLLQRPGSSRGAGGESLIFRASSRG